MFHIFHDWGMVRLSNKNIYYRACRKSGCGKVKRVRVK